MPGPDVVKMSRDEEQALTHELAVLRARAAAARPGKRREAARAAYFAKRDAFAARWSPLVLWTIERSFPRELTPDRRDDAVQNGEMGLLKAVERFDPARGVRFYTYAPWWIRATVYDSVRSTGTLVRIPAYLIERDIKWRRTAAALKRTLGREPDGDAVAAALGLTAAQRGHLGTARNAARVWLECDQSPDDGWRLDCAAYASAEADGDAAAESEDRESLGRALDSLAPRYKAILVSRFGLNGADRLTFDQIGAAYGVSKERVRQIEVKALKQLRAYYEAAAPAEGVAA